MRKSSRYREIPPSNRRGCSCEGDSAARPTHGKSHAGDRSGCGNYFARMPASAGFGAAQTLAKVSRCLSLNGRCAVNSPVAFRRTCSSSSYRATNVARIDEPLNRRYTKLHGCNRNSYASSAPCHDIFKLEIRIDNPEKRGVPHIRSSGIALCLGVCRLWAVEEKTFAGNSQFSNKSNANGCLSPFSPKATALFACRFINVCARDAQVYADMTFVE